MATTAPLEFSMQRTLVTDRTTPVRWIWSHARQHWWLIIMMLIGAIGNASLGAVVPVLTGDAFNAMLKPSPDTSVLVSLAIIIGLSQVVRGALQLR
jgi:ATP-binding cassette subfamily B protein